MENKEMLKEMGAAQTKVDFGIKDTLDSRKNKISLGGDVLFKDIQLFIPELIFNISLIVFGLIGVILVRFISNNFLFNEIEKQVSPIVFEMIISHILFLQNVIIIALVVPVVYSLGLFVFKWFFFYPRGKKNFVIRSWKMGISRISVEEIPENYISFEGKKEDTDKMHINFSKAGIEYYTGRKIIHLQEGLSENTSMHNNLITNEKVKDRGNVNASMFSAAVKFVEMQNKKMNGFWQNPTNLVLIAILVIIIAIGAFMVLKQPESVASAVQSALSKGGA